MEKEDKDLQGGSQAKQKSQDRTVHDMEGRWETTCLECGMKLTLIYSWKWLGLKQSSNEIY